MIERRAQAWKDMQRDALVIDGNKRKQNNTIQTKWNTNNICLITKLCVLSHLFVNHFFLFFYYFISFLIISVSSLSNYFDYLIQHNSTSVHISFIIYFRKLSSSFLSNKTFFLIFSFLNIFSLNISPQI